MKNKNEKDKEKEKKEKEETKSNFISYNDSRVMFKFPDNSIYFGTIAYLDGNGTIITNIEELPIDQREKSRVVRHGNGVQLFGFDETTGNYTYKYEGAWIKDRKNGHGKIEFSDGDMYEGNFLNDKFDGEVGEYQWKSKYKYKGQWRDGKMEGIGTFTNRDGAEYTGKFKSNYYIDEKNLYIDPFTPKEMVEVFKKKGYENIVKNQSLSDFFSINSITKVGLEDLEKEIIKCFEKRNKVPFILRGTK